MGEKRLTLWTFLAHVREVGMDQAFSPTWLVARSETEYGLATSVMLEIM